MPHTRSAKKNLRKSDKARVHNKSIYRAVKTQEKKFLDVLGSGTIEQARTEYNLAAKKLDMAAAKHVVHRNLAVRKKSQLARKLHAKQTGAKPAAK